MASKETTRRERKAATNNASRAKPGAYPFVSKAEVRYRLSSGDRAFITACLRVMAARTAERAAGRAPRAHRWGWGSADSAAGAVALSERVLSGKPAYGDQKRAAALLAKYTVQIAEALRLEAMKKEPELVVTAKVYGVAPPRRRR
jgi:hypothetical protein